jgi:hypothetical protein
LGDNSAGTYNSAFADRQPGQYDSPTTDGAATFKHCFFQDEVFVFADWISIVRQRDIGANKYIILNCHTSPHLHPIFDGDAVAYNCTAFNKAMRADIAVHANRRTLCNYAKLPNGRASANVFGLANGCGMDLHVARQLLGVFWWIFMFDRVLK